MKPLLYAGIASLVVGLALFIVDVVEVNFFGLGPTVTVYPAAFFVLLGLVLLFRAARTRIN